MAGEPVEEGTVLEAVLVHNVTEDSGGDEGGADLDGFFAGAELEPGEGERKREKRMRGWEREGSREVRRESVR